MFERRLKIFLLVLIGAGLVLFGRAFTLQVVGRSVWVRAAQRLAVRPPELTDAMRGRILDVRGTPLAVDQPCTDACVDYHAIVDPPDPAWVRTAAVARLKRQYGTEFAPGSRTFPPVKRKAMIADASAAVTADVNAMWATLAVLQRPTDPDAAAAVAADPRAAMDDVRRGIVRQVEMRRRVLWTLAADRAHARAGTSGRLMRWLGLVAADDAGEGADAAPSEAYAVTTGEQEASHVVLHAVDGEAAAFLTRRLPQFPGLSLRPSTHRLYPLKSVACHVLGQTSAPSTQQVKQTQDEDAARRYEAAETDVGREGVEALCEPLLRGVRGRVDRRAGDGSVVDQSAAVPGRDVRLTIDADLQARAQQLLQHVVEHGRLGDDPHAFITPAEGVSMHGAAVVIDVRTNEVRALASNPGFDVNDLETRFAALNADGVEDPLDDRATSDAVEPGSTVKPLLGTAAVTQGTVGPLEGIECTGNMYLPVIGPDGTRTKRRYRMQGGRCWVVSEYGAELAKLGKPIDHHRVPTQAPHVGHDNNPDGWLTLSDAIERSCDVYFETVADRMGPVQLCQWYDRWGLGRETGVGIHEVPGLRELQSFGRNGGPAPDLRRTNCLAGMGQDKTLATPLQIANAAAALARGGVWMRPRLLTDATRAALDAARPPGSTPDRVDLHLSPAALQQARLGMEKVVLGEDGRGTGGTGGLPEWDHPAWLTVAAKTGTADTAPFRYLAKGPDGRLVPTKLTTMDVRGGPETATPWYRSETGTGVVHAWYMGYAPADDPQVAFAVLIEYAGIGGGPAAGPVAAGLLDACLADGYLHPPGGTTTGPATPP